MSAIESERKKTSPSRLSVRSCLATESAPLDHRIVASPRHWPSSPATPAASGSRVAPALPRLARESSCSPMSRSSSNTVTRHRYPRTSYEHATRTRLSERGMTARGGGSPLPLAARYAPCGDSTDAGLRVKRTRHRRSRRPPRRRGSRGRCARRRPRRPRTSRRGRPRSRGRPPSVLRRRRTTGCVRRSRRRVASARRSAGASRAGTTCHRRSRRASPCAAPRRSRPTASTPSTCRR
mmetsp:Transcript_2166/g.8368  ORF Transcript_2166/g.8368 Transcript_2166/m.8368 type:complete len:237 (-) Transcript_2166:231-941(-)